MSFHLLVPCTTSLCLICSSVVVAQLPTPLKDDTTASYNASYKVYNNQSVFETGLNKDKSDQNNNPKVSSFLQTRFTSSELLAQSVPSVPPGTLEPPRQPPPLPETLPSPAPAPPLTSPQPLPPQPSSLPEARVRVKRVEVLGSTVFSSKDLAEVVAPFVGKELSFEQLLELRTAVTNLYTSKGHTTSGAFLPPQDFSSGAIQVQVVEGELEKIEIQGQGRLRKSYVLSRIRLAAKTPLNIHRLEEALQLLQLDPLFSLVQAELTAGTGLGRSILVLNLKEAPPLHSALIVENREPPSVGEIGGTAALSHNNVLGLGDRLSAEVGPITEGVTSYNIGYAIPLNARNGTLGFRYSNGRNRVIDQFFAPVDINGRAQTYSISFRQPISRTPTSEFALGLSVDWRQSRTFLFDDEPFSFVPGPEKGESKVTVLRFSQDWVNRSPNRVLAARSQFSFGLGLLGATSNDAAPDGQFFSWLGQAQWVQALNEKKDAVFVARAAAQLTPDSLLPLEQFSIGGIDTVRGYRENQRVGDNGIIGSAELRFPIVRDPDGFGLLQIVPFIDVGTIWSNNGASADSSTLVSTGLGLRWQLSSRFSASLDWGIPLISIDDQGDSLQDNGISFSIRMEPF